MVRSALVQPFVSVGDDRGRRGEGGVRVATLTLGLKLSVSIMLILKTYFSVSVRPLSTLKMGSGKTGKESG